MIRDAEARIAAGEEVDQLESDSEPEEISMAKSETVVENNAVSISDDIKSMNGVEFEIIKEPEIEEVVVNDEIQSIHDTDYETVKEYNKNASISSQEDFVEIEQEGGGGAIVISDGERESSPEFNVDSNPLSHSPKPDSDADQEMEPQSPVFATDPIQSQDELIKPLSQATDVIHIDMTDDAYQSPEKPLTIYKKDKSKKSAIVQTRGLSIAQIRQKQQESERKKQQELEKKLDWYH